jgi:cation:H+ antiporter
MLAINLLLLVFGLLVLSKGADFLVDGSTSIAQRFRVPSLVIGLTIVAFGTSMPELVVSLSAALSGSSDIALGNVIGSNIFNIFIILGVCSLIHRLDIGKSTVWKEIPFSFLAGLVVAVLGLKTVLGNSSFFALDLASKTKISELGVADGLILLMFFVIFMFYTFGLTSQNPDETKENFTNLGIPKSLLYILGGLVGLILGGKLVVDNAILLAQGAGVSEKLIGLTIVSAGTSLPELVTSIKATQKGLYDIAIGNVVGSNIFNIFAILGITTLVRPIPMDGQNIADILVLFVATILLFFFNFILKRFSLGKFEGSVFLLLYAGYVFYLGIR